jgi:D-inositol-3-phosphate glycosyltransferase
VIPCGVNLDLFRPIDRGIASKYINLKGKDFILYVGRIDPVKGLEPLIEALALLDGMRVELVVVGGGQESQPQVERLRELSRGLRVEDSVTFHGLAKQEILPYFYSAARACVIPSYYETFGLVILESLACGTPVVATPVGCAERVVQHGVTGYVVAVNTPRLLADTMARVLSSSNGELAPPESIRASIVRFGWSQIADAIEREYRSVGSNDGRANGETVVPGH